MTDPNVQARSPRLSVAMIVRNEEEVLADSVESVQSIADEIVVLDTGSTDGTVELARRLGARVSQTVWSDDFSAARNHCLRQTTGEWILWLDAGERLAGESAQELRRFVDRRADVKKVYLLVVRLPSADGTSSDEQMAQPRLLPRHPQLQYAGRIRETLEPSMAALGLQLEAGPGRIVCHGHRRDPAWRTLRAQGHLRLAAQEKQHFGDHSPARVWLAEGDAYCDLAAQQDARAAYLAALESAEHGSSEMLEAYYGLLTTYDGDEFLQQIQLTTCLEALEVFPFDAQLLLAMGNYLQRKGRLDLAVRCFDTAVKYGQVDLGTWHLVELAEMAAVCLSLALQGQSQDTQATEILEEALRRSPRSNRLRRQLIDLHVRHGRCNEALKLAEHLPVASDQREPLRNAIRGAARAAKEDWTPALAYLQSAYVAGCQDPLCLRWLAVTLLSNGQIEATRPVLAQWRQVDPTNAELLAYCAALQAEDTAAAVAEEVAGALPQPDCRGKRWRVDQGTVSTEASPPILPIVSQDCSTGWWQSAGNPSALQ